MKKLLYAILLLIGMSLLFHGYAFAVKRPDQNRGIDEVDQDAEKTVEAITDARKLFPVFIYQNEFDEASGAILDHTEYRTETGGVIDVSGIEDAGYFEFKEETVNGYLYPAKKDGAWGYLSSSGEWAIQPQYVYAGSFHDGTALVVIQDNTSHTNTTFAYIDPFGRKLIEWQLPEMIGPIREGRAIRYTKTNQSQTCIDIIDVSGNAIASHIIVDSSSLKPEYQSGVVRQEGCFYVETLCYSQGLLCVSLNGEYGYLNVDGTWAIPPQYSYAQNFTEGRAVVGDCRGHDEILYGYIDLTGQLVIPMTYPKAWPFSEGKAAVLLNRETEEVQFIYPDGNDAFAGGYYSKLKGGMQIQENEPLIFREGYCVIYEESSDYRGIAYIDSDGNNMRELWQLNLHDIGANGRIAYATSFRNGLARVSDGATTWYINQEGKRMFDAKEIENNGDD